MQLTQKAKAIIIGLTVPLAIAGGATGMLVADYQNVADRAAALEAQAQQRTAKPVTKTSKARKTKPAKVSPQPFVTVTKYVPVRIKPQIVKEPMPTPSKPTVKATPKAVPKATPEEVPTKTESTPPAEGVPRTPNPDFRGQAPNQYKPKTDEDQ